MGLTVSHTCTDRFYFAFRITTLLFYTNLTYFHPSILNSKIWSITTGYFFLLAIQSRIPEFHLAYDYYNTQTKWKQFLSDFSVLHKDTRHNLEENWKQSSPSKPTWIARATIYFREILYSLLWLYWNYKYLFEKFIAMNSLSFYSLCFCVYTHTDAHSAFSTKCFSYCSKWQLNPF